MYVYIGTHANKLKVAEINDKTGLLIQIVQSADAVIDPRPANVTDKDMMETEWVLKHPKFPLLHAFTSFWNKAQARVTTYRIDESGGLLTPLGWVETGGYQAAHALFSHDHSTICVSHYNDGNLTFFDCSQDKELDPLLKVVETPEIVPGTRVKPASGKSLTFPGLHHAQHAPNGKYLLTVDCSAQGCVWTCAVDSQGRLTSDAPVSKTVLPQEPSYPSWVTSFTKLAFSGSATSIRLRRATIHPNGKHVHVLHELGNCIQVCEIDETGKIGDKCLQAIPALNDDFFNCWHFKGIAMNVAAELHATDSGVWVSNRGVKLFGRTDVSLRCHKCAKEGAALQPPALLQPAGSVRHFLFHENKVLSGVNSASPGSLEMFAPKDGDDSSFSKVGEAVVGVDILGMACCVPS